MEKGNLENIVATIKEGLGFILRFPNKAPENIFTGMGTVEEEKPYFARLHFPKAVVYRNGAPKELRLTAYVTPEAVTAVGTTGEENYEIPLKLPHPREYV